MKKRRKLIRKKKTLRIQLIRGDCLSILTRLEPNSIDAMVTDPPAGISFMGKKWDGDKGGRDEWIDWLSRVMSLSMQKMKPGAHGLVWSFPRTSHWTGEALELAGFEIRDCVAHVFGTGFPKSHYVLKPAMEFWWLVRKPIKGSIADNSVKHGTGTLNIDECRIETNNNLNGGRYSNTGPGEADGSTYGHGINTRTPGGFTPPPGRWPTNLLLSHSPACIDGGACSESCAVAEMDRQSGERPGATSNSSPNGKKGTACYGDFVGYEKREGRGDSGGASRFFPRFRYQAKAPKKERGEGNNHPTVKSLELTKWLCALITPPGGIILDPFMGSGTTGIAAKSQGFSFVGIEKEKEYFRIAKERIGS